MPRTDIKDFILVVVVVYAGYIIYNTLFMKGEQKVSFAANPQYTIDPKTGLPIPLPRDSTTTGLAGTFRSRSTCTGIPYLNLCLEDLWK